MRRSTGEATVERLLAAGHVGRVQGAQADGASWSAVPFLISTPSLPAAAGGLVRKRRR